MSLMRGGGFEGVALHPPPPPPAVPSRFLVPGLGGISRHIIAPFGEPDPEL